MAGDASMSGTDIVKYETDHGEIELSAPIVRQYLVSGGGTVSDGEIKMFIELCRYQGLNPFLREAYLIKYGGNQPAAIVTGKDVYTKRAAKHPKYDGFEAGIVVKRKGAVLRPEGSLPLEGDTVLGGWAKVYIKGQRVPTSAEVSLKEYEGHKADGSVTKMWSGKKATMIRKVALTQAMREAFPESFQGMYSAEELGIVTDATGAPLQQVDGEAPAVPVRTVSRADGDAFYREAKAQEMDEAGVAALCREVTDGRTERLLELTEDELLVAYERLNQGEIVDAEVVDEPTDEVIEDAEVVGETPPESQPAPEPESEPQPEVESVKPLTEKERKDLFGIAMQFGTIDALTMFVNHWKAEHDGAGLTATEKKYARRIAKGELTFDPKTGEVQE